MIHAGPEGLPAKTQAVAFAPATTVHAVAPGQTNQSVVLAVAELWRTRDTRDPVDFSRALTEIVGRPVLVIDLAAVPHAPTVRGTGNHTEAQFTPAQLVSALASWRGRRARRFRTNRRCGNIGAGGM